MIDIQFLNFMRPQIIQNVSLNINNIPAMGLNGPPN
jgi:hypothetical protein